MEENKKNILLIVICVIFVVLFVVVLFTNNRSEDNMNSTTSKINMVTDQNRFFTVSSCVSKYLSYLSLKDTDNILYLIDENYKNEHGITSANLYDYVKQLDGEYEFTANMMYQEQVDGNIMKYYVSGFIKPSLLLDSAEEYYQIERENFYVIVNLDLRQQVFSIVPYDGAVFQERGAS